jgi:hypothetical protein
VIGPCPVPNYSVSDIYVRHGGHKTITPAANQHDCCSRAACYRTIKRRNPDSCQNHSDQLRFHALFIFRFRPSTGLPLNGAMTIWKTPVNALLVRNTRNGSTFLFPQYLSHKISPGACKFSEFHSLLFPTPFRDLLQISNFKFQISNFKFQISNFKFRISIFGFSSLALVSYQSLNLLPQIRYRRGYLIGSSWRFPDPERHRRRLSMRVLHPNLA